MKQQVLVGQPIPDLMHNSGVVPIEAEITLHRSDYYRHEYPLVWRHTQARALIDGYYLSNAVNLHRLPDKSEGFELPLISEAEWKWRIRDSALAAAERSGVANGPVLSMCRQFGAGEVKLAVGQVVSNCQDIQVLPNDTIVYSAHPNAIDAFKVWRVLDGVLKPLLGTESGRPNGYPVVIHSMPSLPEGMVLPVEEKPATLEQLAQISLRAWRVGKVFKQRQSWCGVFENTLTSLGIDENTAKLVHETMYGPGDELDREQTSNLPVGTLLWHNWVNRIAAAVYVRDDRSRNKSRTRRVWGWEDDGVQSHDRMTVVKTPQEPMVWRVSGSILRHMPNGTGFTLDGQRVSLDDGMRLNLATWISYIVHSFPEVAE